MFETDQKPTMIAEALAVSRGTFGDAIAALKLGHRVQRSGWNGKGMWLVLTEGSELGRIPGNEGASYGTPGSPLARALSGAVKALAETEGPLVIRICAHIDMRAADGSLVIGWLASQTDMLATDWRVL